MFIFLGVVVGLSLTGAYWSAADGKLALTIAFVGTAIIFVLIAIGTTLAQGFEQAEERAE